MQIKTCTKCNLQKSVQNFYKAKQGRFGVKAVCKSCVAASDKVRKSLNKDQQKLYYKVWCQENPDKKQAATKSWIQDNYDKVLSYNALRRASKKQATLPGYLKEIEEIYWLARDLRTITGENYHVDHIVPLKGKEVCGLHVPWNLQVLPADINLAKGNKILQKEMV